MSGVGVLSLISQFRGSDAPHLPHSAARLDQETRCLQFAYHSLPISPLTGPFGIPRGLCGGKEGWLFLCHSPWDTQKGLSPHLQRRWPRSQELIVDLTLDSLQLNTRWSLGHKNPLVVATEPEPPRTEFLREATTRTSC